MTGCRNFRTQRSWLWVQSAFLAQQIVVCSVRNQVGPAGSVSTGWSQWAKRMCYRLDGLRQGKWPTKREDLGTRRPGLESQLSSLSLHSLSFVTDHSDNYLAEVCCALMSWRVLKCWHLTVNEHKRSLNNDCNCRFKNLTCAEEFKYMKILTKARMK